MFIIEYINQKYGCYTIIEKTNKKAKDGHYIYKAVCDCGAERFETFTNIKYGSASNCPHYNYYGNIKILKPTFKDKRIASIFYGMMRRCYDPFCDDYEAYGEKGICVYQEWIDNPLQFEAWSLNNGYEKELTIDRVNESGDYAPHNCRWVTREINSRFKSNTNYITATVTLSGRQWSKLIPDIGVNYINTLIRKQGEEAAIKFIEDKLKNKYDLVSK